MAWRGRQVPALDFLRAATRNLAGAGVPEVVLMWMVVWKTQAMLDRYNISSEAALYGAVAKLMAGKA